MKKFFVLALMALVIGGTLTGCASINESIARGKKINATPFEKVFPAGANQYGILAFATKEEMLDWYAAAMVKANTKSWSIGKGGAGILTGDIPAASLNGSQYTASYYVDTKPDHYIALWVTLSNGERAILHNEYWIEGGYVFNNNALTHSYKVWNHVELSVEYPVWFSKKSIIEYLGESSPIEYVPSFDAEKYLLDYFADNKALHSSGKLTPIFQGMVDIQVKELEKDSTDVKYSVNPNGYIEFDYLYKGEEPHNRKMQILTESADLSYWKVWVEYDPIKNLFHDWIEVSEDVLYFLLRAFYSDKVTDMDVQQTIERFRDGKNHSFRGSDRNEQLFMIISVKNEVEAAKTLAERNLK
jgi:hypothetical protein